MKLKCLVSCRVAGVGDFKAGDTVEVKDETGRQLLADKPVRFAAMKKESTKAGKK